LLLLSAGSIAQPQGATDPSSDKLQIEIDRILKVDQGAIAETEEAVQLFGRIEELVLGLARVGDFETARALAKKGAVLFPEERRSLVLLGWTEGLAGRYEGAIDITRSALGAPSNRLPDPDDAALRNAKTNLAGFLIHEGEQKEALELLELAAQQGSDLGATQYLLGQAYFELGEPYLSAKAYERALREAEGLATPEDYFRYATALDRMGKLDRAAKTLQTGIKNLPNASGLYVNLGLNAEARGATPEAYLHYWMETEVSGPDSPFSQAAAQRIGRIETLQSKSSFPDVSLQSLIAYLNLQRQKTNPENTDSEIDAKIEKAYAVVFEIKWPEHPLLELLQAEFQTSAEASDEAIEILEEAREKYPNQVLFTLELAKVYGEIGDASKSDALIRDGLLNAPDHWKVQRMIGPSLPSN
jgi:tetratricopeptide (TPR) repeat protein